MATCDLVEYAVCFGSDCLTDEQISKAFSALWESTWKRWNLPSDFGTVGDDKQDEFSAELDREDERLDTWTKKAWFKVGRGLYLLLTESNWSHGDICGFFRVNELIGTEDAVVAFPIASAIDFPTQGLINPQTKQEIHEWREQAKTWFLVSRPQIVLHQP